MISKLSGDLHRSPLDGPALRPLTASSPFGLLLASLVGGCIELVAKETSEPTAVAVQVTSQAGGGAGSTVKQKHAMGRSHKDVVVIVAHDADGRSVGEDIVPRQNFGVSGSLLLNSAIIRQRDRIRTISVRIFDEHGVRLESEMRYFASDGSPVAALHRRPD